MTTKDPNYKLTLMELGYEHYILQHLENDLGCPDYLIGKEFIQNPQQSRQLREEARNHNYTIECKIQRRIE